MIIRILLFSLFVYASHFVYADEGMWPVTEIERIGLNNKGLALPLEEIYNPNGVSLMNAIIRLSGCTASFVSSDGLILTNHHCAFRAVQQISTTDSDYLTNGFLAKSRVDEIPAPGYTANILEFYKDVSEEVLSSVNDSMDLLERSKAIEKKQKELILQAEADYPGKRAEISEMFIGKTYVLFVYTRLKDIRMVYIPPLSIGSFGGEEDNWIWPRHTGDFSFFRAYVAPDGSPAELSMENVPYKPQVHFQVAPQGVEENDFVFVMGYPGRTYRHRTSYFLEYEEKIRMPYIADEYDKAISIMEEFSRKDPQAALTLAAGIKSLSNRMKNFRGKLTGMKRLNLVAERRAEEEKLQEFIMTDPERRERYSTVLSEIKSVYEQIAATARRDLLISNIFRLSTPLRNARTIYKDAENREKPDIERESAYMSRNINRTKLRLFLGLKSFYSPSEIVILDDLLQQVQNLPSEQRIHGFDNILSGMAIEEYVSNLYEESQYSDQNYVRNAFKMNLDSLSSSEDPAMKTFLAIKEELDTYNDNSKQHNSALEKLHPGFVQMKKDFQNEDFIPDANSTFRLTYGYIHGYHPRDAVYYSPITGFQGVLEKSTGTRPFITPPELINIYNNRDYGQFFNNSINDIPVAILYNMDTTGGNSGSPVLNSKGELIGVNFDRAWEATINDYGWSKEYSRSIGVDIRYVLWVTQKLAGADHLLREMNVPVVQ